MTARSSIPGYRAGFLFVVVLLAAVTGYTLYAEVRTNEEVDKLVSRALERHELIGRIRVDALSLEGAVDDHIRGSAEERADADQRMKGILDDINDASQEYTGMMPRGEREAELWNDFSAQCKALAARVREAVSYSNRKQAEAARKHLVEEVRPISAQLDDLGDQLSSTNAEDTKKLVRSLEHIRLRSTELGALIAAIAVVVSLLVAFRVSSVISKQERTIGDQLAELNRRNQELDSFASRVAHDLVAPLSPLKGYLTLIRRSNSISDPQVVEMLSLAESSAGRMAEMIEALLRFCRAGTTTEPAIAELDTAVSTILLEVGQSAALQNVSLERYLDARVPVPCSAQLLHSIAQNLLSNAVKYTAGRPQARVVVRVWRERGEGVLEVTDNGLGMSEASQRSLFQPFFRAPEARGLPGHGLGLATTKRLVEAHGGTIVVHSELNVGTQVIVRFPLATPPPFEGLSGAASNPVPAESR